MRTATTKTTHVHPVDLDPNIQGQEHLIASKDSNSSSNNTPIMSPTTTSSPSPSPHQNDLAIFNAPTSHSTQPFPLLSLPLDILTLHLPPFLPAPSLLSLRLSNRTLYTTLYTSLGPPKPKTPSTPTTPPTKTKTSSPCTRTSILNTLNETPETGKRKCCLLCGSWYPLNLFTWTPLFEQDTNPSQVQKSRLEGGIVLENRICRWHRARFQRTLLVKPKSLRTGTWRDMTGMEGGRKVAKREEVQEETEEVQEEMEEVEKGKEEEVEEWKQDQGWQLLDACMHCGGVLDWDRCECGERCQVCWKRVVWCFTRVVEEEC